MKIIRTFILKGLLALLAGTACGCLPAMAGGTCLGISFSCDNGRTYSLCPIAVSDAGEIATAYLTLSPRSGTYMRLVPMGVGYRYIGHGIWLDGVRDEAVLNFGKNRSVACTIGNN